MVTKLNCQLPDYDAFGRKGRLSFDPECVQDLGWTPQDQNFRFNPDHNTDVPAKNTQRSHPMQSEKCSHSMRSQTQTMTLIHLTLDSSLILYYISVHNYV